MLFVVFFPLVVSLAIYFVPVLLLHRQNYHRAQDFFVASTSSSPRLFQNSSIAYQLQMATFGPFFLWGATGDFLPAIVNSAFFSAGLFLIYFFRAPLFAFLAQALGSDTSITLHEFIARQHGNDARVRVAASLLTLFALFGLALGESVGLAAVLKPFLPESVEATYVLTFLILMLVFFYSMLAGNTGVMRSDQTHLGVAYVGLFATTGVFLGILVAKKTDLSPQSALAIAIIGAVCAAMLVYRKFRIIDATRLIDTGYGNTVRAFQLFEKALNLIIIVLAIGVIALAVFSLRDSFGNIPDGFRVALSKTQFSAIGLLALALLPLFYGVVDITNWQRLAAMEKSGKENRTVSTFKSAFFVYAIESPLIWLYMCMFGALAFTVFVPQGDKDLGSFIQQIVDSRGPLPLIALASLVASAFAMSLSTINSVFAGSLCAIRYDILPAISDASSRDKAINEDEFQRQARRRTSVLGVIFYLTIVLALYCSERFLKIKFGSAEFIALLFAFYCAQLSFVPLIFGPILSTKAKQYLTVSAPWALAVLACGLFAGLAPVSIFLVTGNDQWLWAAVPLCLCSGFLVFALGLLVVRHLHNKSIS